MFINDSLHHLNNAEEVKRCFCEIKRVLKDGGLFAFYEPANTIERKIATKMVFSPLSYIFRRTRLLRQILTEEIEEYNYWLKNIPLILGLLGDFGFSILRRKRTPIHMAVISRLNKK